MKRRRRTAIVVVSLVCAGVTPACLKKEQGQQVVVRDDGVLCLGSDVIDVDAGKAFGQLEAFHPLPITVRSYGCLSDKCSTHRVAKCSAKLEGTKIVLTSELSWQAPDGLDPCKGTCSMLDAKCTVDGINDGKYTVVLGGRTYPIEVPSRIPSACLKVPPRVDVPPPVIASDGDASTPAAPIASGLLQPAAVVALAAPPATGAASPAVPTGPDEKVCLIPLTPTAAKKGAKPTAAKLEPLSVSITRRNACIANACLAGVPKCTAKKKGKDHIAIAVSYTGPSGKGGKRPCTDDCETLTGTCRTEPLAPGTYTIEATGHASTRIALPPQTTSPTCLP